MIQADRPTSTEPGKPFLTPREFTDYVAGLSGCSGGALLITGEMIFGFFEPLGSGCLKIRTFAGITIVESSQVCDIQTYSRRPVRQDTPGVAATVAS